MRLANPGPLALFGFSTTTWLLSMVDAGWLPAASLPVVLVMAFAYGGTAQFAAGLMEMVKGNSFGFISCCSFAAFWWSFALFHTFFATGVPAIAVGWYELAWAAFTFVMWLASFVLSRSVFLVFLWLWITLVLQGLSSLLGIHALFTLGGYTGLITALCAFYAAAAEIINECHGRILLPVGAPFTKRKEVAAF